MVKTGDTTVSFYIPDDDEWEREQIFGSDYKATPKKIEITEEQKADPLRAAKVIISGFLTAEKEPITSAQLKRRMMEEDGKIIDYGKYGFNTLDDLMNACPKELEIQVNRNGHYTYSVRTTDVNADIKNMVSNQKNKEQMRQISFFHNSRKKNSQQGAAFRNMSSSFFGGRQEPAQSSSNEYHKIKIVSINKTVQRVQDIALFIKYNKEKMGVKDPSNPQNKVVPLMKLQEVFVLVQKLPLWGKMMTEAELYAEFSQPLVSQYLRLFRIPNQDCTYIDAVEGEDVPMDLQPVIPIIREEPPLILPSPEPRFVQMEKPKDQDLFFLKKPVGPSLLETGPGFTPRDEDSDVLVSEYISNRFGIHNSIDELDASFRRGAGEYDSFKPRNSAPAFSNRDSQRRLQSLSHLKTENEKTDDVTLKRLYLAVSQQGKLNFDTLKDNEKKIVSQNGNIFAVTSVKIGESIVTLSEYCQDDCDLDSLSRSLRPVIEQDVRGLTSTFVKLPEGVYQAKLESFVAPRGFILKVSEETADTHVTLIADKLEEVMLCNPEPYQYHQIEPGMASILVYRTDDDAQYFRVLIVGNTLQKEGEVLATLVDVNDVYFVNANVKDLYPLPSKVSFERFAPAIVFATMCGIGGVPLEYQKMIKNELDKNKITSIVYLYPGDHNTVPQMDVICTDEKREARWFSKVLKEEEGTVPNYHQSYSHYKINVDDLRAKNRHLREMLCFKSIKKAELAEEIMLDDRSDETEVLPNDSDDEVELEDDDDSGTNIEPENSTINAFHSTMDEVEEKDQQQQNQTSMNNNININNKSNNVDFVWQHYKQMFEQKNASAIVNIYNFVGDLAKNNLEEGEEGGGRWEEMRETMKKEVYEMFLLNL